DRPERHAHVHGTSHPDPSTRPGRQRPGLARPRPDAAPRPARHAAERLTSAPQRPRHGRAPRTDRPRPVRPRLPGPRSRDRLRRPARHPGAAPVGPDGLRG
ncbi:MAG: hypothetical protein AVDCRST_MAG60-1206, partial [uncultured Nocardioides sp.]